MLHFSHLDNWYYTYKWYQDFDVCVKQRYIFCTKGIFWCWVVFFLQSKSYSKILYFQSNRVSIGWAELDLSFLLLFFFVVAGTTYASQDYQQIELVLQCSASPESINQRTS